MFAVSLHFLFPSRVNYYAASERSFYFSALKLLESSLSIVQAAILDDLASKSWGEDIPSLLWVSRAV